MDLEAIIERHKVVVCVGSGGVGKTTTAAAIGLWAALRGKRSMVLTIDPARRLAQSLGLSTLTATGERISVEPLTRLGVDVPGVMEAGMLDQKSAWDEFIVRHSPSQEVAQTILRNEFYQHLSRSFAGSTEYMAIEELCRLHDAGRHDLLVLDTPPTSHALDFLEAPQRLRNLLDRSVVAWLVKPYAAVGWSAWKTASRGVRFLFSRIEEATGIQTLTQISEFFVAMEEVFDNVNERSRRVQDLLRGEATAFVLVAGPEEQILGECDQLCTRMDELGMPLKGVVMNRVHPDPYGPEGEPSDEALAGLRQALLERGADRDACEWLLETYRGACAVARAEGVRREEFELGLSEGVEVTSIPEMDHDVHDLAGLHEVVEYLSRKR